MNAQLGNNIIEFLRNRISEMGVDASGAYNYYDSRVQKNVALAEYERVLISHILQSRPSRVVHAGIGVGQLIAFLADAGISCIGYDGDRRRYVAAEAMKASLGLNYELRCSNFPDQDLGQGGLLLFTNVGAGWTDQIEQNIISSFAHFERVILDLSRFGRYRDTEAARLPLVAAIGRFGKITPLPLVPHGHYIEVSVDH